MAALALTPTVLFSKFKIVLLVRISLEPFSAITSLLPPANEVCEGYVFTGVCLSTGGLWQTPPWADHPPPLGQTPHHWADHPPLGRHPPTSPPPPVQCMLGYGQQAGGTHPTGMHSC